MAALVTTVATAIKAAGIGKVLSIGGTALTATGSVAAGQAAKAGAEYEAKQLEARGKAELASSTAKAAEEDRQKRLVLSRARAAAAASGGGQDIDLLGDLEEEGTYRTGLAIWEGTEAMKGRKSQAAATRATGDARAKAGWLGGATALLRGAPSFYDQYR